MAKDKNNFKEKTDADLNALMIEKQEALLKIRFEATGGKGKGQQSAGKLRKDIARIQTEVRVRKTK